MVAPMYDVLGQAIPPNTAHAVSVSIPTWRSNVGYGEKEGWVMDKLKTGYPRFLIHESIARFADDIIRYNGNLGEQCFLFPSHSIATRCLDFFHSQDPSLVHEQIRIIELIYTPSRTAEDSMLRFDPHVYAVVFPQEQFKIAKMFWQHTGDGISSRRADFCHSAYRHGNLVEKHRIDDGSRPELRSRKGPKRYFRDVSMDGHPHIATKESHADAPTSNGSTGPSESQEHAQFIEERFGRNLDLSLIADAKLAIEKRIAGSLTSDCESDVGATARDPARPTQRASRLSTNDVYLFPTGMSAIFNSHRIMMAARGALKSICFGFPYVDTLKILQKWGPGCLFYGHGSTEELDDLERRLQSGERYLALFCELPSNPLLRSPDLVRIRDLALTYDFAVVVDETVGNFVNVNVTPYADAIVSSLTKIFSGEANVMGGSLVLNPASRYYTLLKRTFAENHEDHYWPEDVLFMERNSRDFYSRNLKINENAEAICDVLRGHPNVKEVFYPKYSKTRANFDRCRTSHGGYGGLLSVVFSEAAEAVVFLDRVETYKGPSLGTNFTLTSPYVLLAHYRELDWVAQYGVEANLVRVSVGLEDTNELVTKFEDALAAAAGAKS
ncbi:MAG: hypothetical protein M1833_005078 [Piccolia ochrophora]|nr:MAG: hypothetical protein M1833_005078 [Piccolia ochrophora]